MPSPATRRRTTPPARRIAVLRRFNALREREAEKIAHLISLENGSAGWFTRAGQPGLTRQAEYLVSHREVDKIAFTGSTRAGCRIASIAGGRAQARQP
ncbi:aldehyde dehydrogenase family protein [Streptomyces collinus]|uniref:aldehyde dehydrogenase family protein n=1 Tax=Streptomyces collinus TaxID=42684 RepID=UPI0033CF7268